MKARSIDPAEREKDALFAGDTPVAAASVQVNDAALNADGDRFGPVRGVQLL
jgi:hypothetical protein